MSTCLGLFLYSAPYVPRKGFFFYCAETSKVLPTEFLKGQPTATHTRTILKNSSALSLSCEEFALLRGTSICFIELGETRFIFYLIFLPRSAKILLPLFTTPHRLWSHAII